uniref:Protein kinase domain-containing protein n=1 Tax=Psilocybe cubensis TaxID=181762 RepID=A0A8H7Y0M7_PSICU
MSLAIRPTLRPVVWSNVDAHGHTLRRERSPDTDSNDEDYYPAKKKKKAIGVPAVYYPPPLSPSEMLWRDRYGYLFQRGYQIRPRYSPNWSPTWLGNGRHHHSGEDHIMQILPQVLDGIRRQDGLVVCIKMIQDRRKLRQVAIVEYFSTRRLLEDSRNHIVPFYDSFGDSFSPHIQFMVTPVLRRFDDPPFLMACEVVDFVSQVLEGLAFMHENNVAHHNLTAEHIMMDAKALVPTGWHFVSHFCEPDGMTRIQPLDRKNHSVRYYFVGFGSCYHISPNKEPLVTDIGGLDDDVPELFTGKPYDPYKLDVYTLANVFLKELYLVRFPAACSKKSIEVDEIIEQKYHGVEFLKDLTDYMRIQDFEKRPGATKVLSRWYRMRSNFNEDELEELPLVYKPGMRPRVLTESPPSSSGGRSTKRDINTIVNRSGAKDRPTTSGSSSASPSASASRPSISPMVSPRPPVSPMTALRPSASPITSNRQPASPLASSRPSASPMTSSRPPISPSTSFPSAGTSGSSRVSSFSSGSTGAVSPKVQQGS